jgi:hypothetical protein
MEARCCVGGRCAAEQQMLADLALEAEQQMLV